MPQTVTVYGLNYDSGIRLFIYLVLLFPLRIYDITLMLKEPVFGEQI